MSLIDDTANDEALARALQEELDAMYVQPPQQKLRPRTVIFTNVIRGPAVPPKRRRAMQNQSLLQGGIEGLETADPEIQEFLAKEADAESEEYEDAFYQEAEDEDNAVESHLTISQRLDRKISANMKPPAAGSDNESSSFATDSQEELAPSQPGSRTEKRQLKKQQMLDTMQKYREDHADFIRVVLIRNTNVKDRKMKFIPPPPNLPDLLRTGMLNRFPIPDLLFTPSLSLSSPFSSSPSSPFFIPSSIFRL